MNNGQFDIAKYKILNKPAQALAFQQNNKKP